MQDLGIAIYHPHIKVRDRNWLKAALLYFEEIKRIVPANYDPSADDKADSQVEEAIQAKAVLNTVVTNERAKNAERKFQNLTQEIQQDTLLKKSIAAGAKEAQNKQFDGQGISNLLNSLKVGDGALIDMWDGKMTTLLADAMKDAGVAQSQEGFLYVEKAIADVYMSCLAAAISEELGYPTVTDSARQTHIEQSTMIARESAQIRTNVITELAVGFPSPQDLANVPMTRILEFREKHRAERNRFRTAIEPLLSAVTEIQNAEVREDFIRNHGKNIKEAIDEQKARVGQLTGVGAHGLFKLFKAGGEMLADPILGILKNLGLVFETHNWYTDISIKMQDQKNKCQWQYLISVEEELTNSK